MLWCDSLNFERQHWCQDNCTRWRPVPGQKEGVPVITYVAGSVGFVIIIFAVVHKPTRTRLCRAFGRCVRCLSWIRNRLCPATGLNVSGPTASDDSMASEGAAGERIGSARPSTAPLLNVNVQAGLTDTLPAGVSRAQDHRGLDEQVVKEPWFALLIGVPSVARRERRAIWFWFWLFRRPQPQYARLDRVFSDVRRLRGQLLKVQPGLQAANIVEVTNARAEDIRKGGETIMHKIAGTTNACVFIFFGGHGHENHLVGEDGELVSIRDFLGNLRLGREKRHFQKAFQPQIVAVFDCCRSRLPSSSRGEKPFMPSFPRKTDGSLYVIYATETGAVAFDGELTDALLQALDVPGQHKPAL